MKVDFEGSEASAQSETIYKHLFCAVHKHLEMAIQIFYRTDEGSRCKLRNFNKIVFLKNIDSTIIINRELLIYRYNSIMIHVNDDVDRNLL